MRTLLLSAWQAITSRVVATVPATADHAVLSADDLGCVYCVDLVDEHGRDTFAVESDYGTAMAAAAKRAAEAERVGHKVVEVVLGWEWFLPGRGSSIVVSYVPPMPAREVAK